MMETETDERIKAIWELHCNMEIGQLQVACDFLRRYEGVDADEILPPALPDVPLTFEPNKDYVREVLATQVDLRPDGLGYTPVDELPKNHRFFAFNDQVNGDMVPSEEVINQYRAERGLDYRDETEGDHPVVDLRASTRAKSGATSKSR
jgi:hypothetical protein